MIQILLIWTRYNKQNHSPVIARDIVPKQSQLGARYVISGTRLLRSKRPRNDKKHLTPISQQKGFTLIEVLIAFSILLVILAALYSSFFISHKAIDGLDESLVKLQECRMSIDTMRRDIDSILYDPMNKNSLFKVEDKDIYGKQTSKLVFTTFSTLRPGLSRISYFVKEKDKKLVLMKELTSAYTPENVAEGFEVVEDIEAFTVEVNYKDTWTKTWDSSLTRTIPQDIRITLTTRLKNKTITLFEIAKPKRGWTL